MYPSSYWITLFILFSHYFVVWTSSFRLLDIQWRKKLHFYSPIKVNSPVFYRDDFQENSKKLHRQINLILDIDDKDVKSEKVQLSNEI